MHYKPIAKYDQTTVTQLPALLMTLTSDLMGIMRAKFE